MMFEFASVDADKDGNGRMTRMMIVMNVAEASETDHE